MALKFIETSLPGVILIEVDLYEDARGFFQETYHAEKYAEGGIEPRFVQDNQSRSVRGTVRGLHYQLTRPQGKLVQVVRGEIFDVAVDIRRGSPAFGRWAGFRLSDENHRQAWIPEGFAHGFQVLSDLADVLYKCTDVYTPGDDYGILWSDPALGIEWPVAEGLLSGKDAGNPLLGDVPETHLPILAS